MLRAAQPRRRTRIFDSGAENTYVHDDDGDGISNRAEDAAGTGPLASSSVLRILSFSNRTVTWSSVSNKGYRILAISDLATNFVPVSSVLTATGATASYLDSAATNSRTFYRVKALP